MRKVGSYERLQNHVKAWIDGDIPFLALIGGPGLGKSYAYEKLLEDAPHHLFKVRATAVQIYNFVHDQPDLPIIFDDVGNITHERTCLDLMKALCDSRVPRTVHWNTNTPILGDRKRSFTTEAPVLLVCNRDLGKNDDVRALLDRADGIIFDPPRSEIISKMKTFARQPRIVDLIERLPVMPTLRTLEKAERWEASPHLDLEEELIAECRVPDQVVVLVRIMKDVPREKWEATYMEHTGRSRRDYYYTKHIAKQLLGVPGSACTLALEGSGAATGNPRGCVR